MTLISQLNTLESAGLIHLAQSQPDLEYLFRHALVQEAAYASLVRRDRQQLHRSVGETIEQLYPDRLSSIDLAPLLARHFDLAHDEVRALKYYTLAADQAAQQYANIEAVAHYSRAIELAAQQEAAAPLKADQIIHLYSSLGRSLQLISRHADALQLYLAFNDLAQQRGDKTMELAAVMERVPLHATPTPLQDPQLSYHLLQQALELAHASGDRPTEAKINWNLMTTELFGGDTGLAVKYGEQSLALARQFDLREQLPFTLNDLAFAYVFLGQMEPGVAALNEVRGLWRANHNLPMLSDSLANSALTEFYLGRFAPSLEFAREGIRVSESINNVWGLSHNGGMLGYTFQETGHLSEALHAWTNSVEFGEQSGLIATRVGIRADLGWLHHLVGQNNVALEQAQRAHAYSETIMPIWKAWSASVLARLYLALNRIDEAQELIGKYCPGDLRQHFGRLLRSGAVNVAIVRGELALAQGKYQAAIKIMDEVLSILQSIGAGPFLDDAYLLKSRSLLKLDRPTDARSVLAQARSAAEAIGSHRLYWQVLDLSSEVESKLGNLIEADRFKQHAKAEIDFLASHIDLEEVKTSFLNQSEIQKVMKAS
jgi:tetratricopeptide (TPR) repeat protein